MQHTSQLAGAGISKGRRVSELILKSWENSLLRLPLHPFSVRFSLGLCAGSLLALFLAFFFQLETPQWAGVSVWIMFMQRPKLNYSKVAFWMAGTLTGAIMASILIICFCQTPEIFLLLLSVWLSVCAALATQLREYRAYGAVLAGYTAAIVSFSAVSQPQRIFEIAVTRVSCVALGVACAVFAMAVFLPAHQHWKETLHHLEEHFRGILREATHAITLGLTEKNPFSWGHMLERLSTVEHTFDYTLAESPDSRARADQARSLTATLFCLATKAQAVGFHLFHHYPSPDARVHEIREGVKQIIEQSVAASPREEVRPLVDATVRLRENILSLKEDSDCAPDHFVLNQLDGILTDLGCALQDRAGLYGKWTAPRASCLKRHRDGLMARLYSARIFLAMGLGAVFWFASSWPGGSSFLLFLAVVCSLLSLLDHAENLGMAYVKSVTACLVASFLELFWLLQNGQGFPFFTMALGLFLVPAAYAYTHPRLAGSAVISMLLFYGLVSPANQMTYDIGVFLNNGLAYIGAATFGFFAFHVVKSPSPHVRQRMLVKAMRRDLYQIGRHLHPLGEQRWVSLVFDRLRLLHRFGGGEDQMKITRYENEIHAEMLWGLRQMGVRYFLEQCLTETEIQRAVHHVLMRSRHFPNRLKEIENELAQTIDNVEAAASASNNMLLGMLGELREMSLMVKIQRKAVH